MGDMTIANWYLDGEMREEKDKHCNRNNGRSHDMDTHTHTQAAAMGFLSRADVFSLVLAFFCWKYCPEFVINQAMTLLVLDWAI